MHFVTVFYPCFRRHFDKIYYTYFRTHFFTKLLSFFWDTLNVTMFYPYFTQIWVDYEYFVNVKMRTLHIMNLYAMHEGLIKWYNVLSINLSFWTEINSKSSYPSSIFDILILMFVCLSLFPVLISFLFRPNSVVYCIQPLSSFGSF